MVGFVLNTHAQDEEFNIDIKLTKLKGDAEGYCMRETDRDFEIEVDSKLTLSENVRNSSTRNTC